MTDKKDTKKILKDLSQNYWTISTVVLAVILIMVLIIGNTATPTINTDAIAQKVVELAEAQGAKAELITAVDNGQLIEVTLSMPDQQGNMQEVSLYATRDGENLILPNGMIPLEIQETPAPTAPAPTQVPTSNRPSAELFIMTHCPYGTQAEKGFISAMKTLQDVANVQIRFVHYFMHDPEETETPIQVCIREEQPSKFLPYLECFLEAGDTDACITTANVDKTKVDECIANGNAAKYYEADSALSQQYGVSGSPTLIVNGAKSSAGRDSASYLAGICSAFNDAPEVCNTELSTAAPSPGFGYTAAGSATTAQC